jgi:PAS domain S-box-containing protein
MGEAVPYHLMSHSAPHDPQAQLGMMPIVARALDRSDNLVAVLRPSPMGVMLHEANDAFCRATRLTADHIAGKRLGDLSGPDTPAALLSRLATLAPNESLRDEMQCRRADETRFWLGFHIMPAIDPVSGADCFVLLGRDISDRREERRQSAAILHLLARVFAAIDAAVAIVTPDGRILKSNPRLQRLVGQEGSALEGSRVLDLIHQDDRGRLEDGLARITGGGAGEHRQILRIGHGPAGRGGSTVAELTAALIDQTDGPQMRLLTFRDVPASAEVFQVAGKIQMIGLGEVKTVLGPRWPALRERAMVAAEHVLSRRLGAQDSFSRTRDDGFLICFAELNEDEASFTAAMIAREIRDRLIGQGEDPDASAVVAIAGSVVLSPPQPVAIPGMPWPQGADPARYRDVVEQRLCAQRAGIEALARQTLAHAVAEARCELAPVVGRDGRQVVAHYARLPPSLHRSLATAAAALPEAERRKTDLDVLALRLAGHQALEQALLARSGTVFLDVSFDVFQSRLAIECYLDACRKLDLSVRQGLVLVLTGLPEGLPSSRMLDCVHRLRPFCRAVGFALDSLELPTLDLALANGPVLVLDATVVPNVQLPSPKLEKLIAHARALRARMLVRGVTERHVSDRLLAGGVDLVGLAPLPG